MRRAMFFLMLVLFLALEPARAVQISSDPRVDPQVIEHLQRHATVPVIVVVSGRMSDARVIWREFSRALDGRYGQVHRPPNMRSEFFAEVNRFGLMILLHYEQVAEVYLPFEATLPGHD